MKKRKPPTSESERDARVGDFFAALGLESDRGVVMLGGAILDELFDALLRSKMLADEDVLKRAVQNLLSIYGPLGSFFAKIQMAYAIGCIKRQTFDDLSIIRDLRNHFAHHSGTISFRDADVVTLCNRLRTPDDAMQLMMTNGPQDSTVLAAALHNQPGRTRFMLTVAYLAAGTQASIRNEENRFAHSAVTASGVN